MDVLVGVREPLLHEGTDVAELDVVRSLKMSVLIRIQHDDRCRQFFDYSDVEDIA